MRRSAQDEGIIMFCKGTDRHYWRNQDLRPRDIFSWLTKEELIVCVADEQWGRSLRKMKKAALLPMLISMCERYRAIALCDRRGAIEHTKTVRQARKSNTSLPS